MPAHSLALEGNRKLVINSLGTLPGNSIQRPFVTLFPAFSPHERQQAEAVAKSLIESGCIEFCTVGPEAELLHDALDEIAETTRAFGVVTTWHEDPVDAFEYFLYAAGAGQASLLALIASHSELLAMLEQEAQRRCG